MKLKYILNLIIFTFVIGAIFAATTYYDLAWTYALAISLSFIGLILFIMLLKRYIQRRRNQNFVKRVISQDKGSYGNDNTISAKENIEQLFFKGIDSINSSSLKNKYKQPLYALPWFYFLGEENSGKTTFLRNSKLTTSLTDMEFNESKRNFNWWFFENLVVFDISGQYAKIENDAKIENEWKVILELTSKYRIKEPLNGIVITISVDSLLNKDEATLINEAIFIRKRINQLMRVVGANFPVYIMVTKFDKLFGLDEVLSNLDKNSLEESFGYINESSEIKSNELFENKLLEIFDNLKNKFETLFVSSLLDKNKPIVYSNQFLNEYEFLNNKLFIYLKTLFRKNEYQYIPKFRGIFYSSSKSDENINSSFFNNYLKNTPIAKTQRSNFFINKFLTKNLTEDRYLFDYLSEFIGWNRVIRSLWLTICIIVISSLSVVTYLSYMENKKVLDETLKLKSIVETNDFGVNIKQLYDSYVIVKLMEEKLNQNLLKDIGFRHANKAFLDSKSLFINNFNKLILNELDSNFSKILTSNQKLNKDSKYDIIMSYLMLNININSKLFSGEKVVFNDAYKETTIKFLNVLGLDSLDLSYKFISSYEQYLNWISNTKALKKRDFILKQQFSDLINLRKGDFQWLVRKDVTNINDITVKDFWPSLDEEYIKNLDSRYRVSGAHTKEGKKKIEQYIKTIKDTLGKDSNNINSFINAFWELYNKAYVNDWELFLRNFPIAIKNYNIDLKSNSMDLLMVTSDSNPYNSVLIKAASELDEVRKKYKKPWIDELLNLKEYLFLSKSNKNDDNSKETIMTSIKNELNNSGSKINERYAEKVNNSILLADYFNSLSKLSFVDSDISFELKSLFSYDKKDSKLEHTYQLLNRFKFKTSSEFKNDFIFNLLYGPFYYVLNYALKKESCFINEQWNKEILAKVSEENRSNRINELFNKQSGYVSGFLEKNLSSYTKAYSGLYSAKIIYDRYSIPFKNDFFNFLNRGFRASKSNKGSYSIKIDSIPISENSTSKIKPYLSSIIVDCMDESFQINNFNFKDSKLFKWSSQNCGDTRVKISFKDFDLIKTYKGKFGFIRLINEFRNGERKFTQEDFPRDKYLMKKYNITWIDTGFSFKGEVNDAIKILDPIPYQIPRKITRCE